MGNIEFKIVSKNGSKIDSKFNSKNDSKTPLQKKRLQTPLHVLQHADIILFSGSHTYTKKKSTSSVYCENNFVKVKLATLETD